MLDMIKKLLFLPEGLPPAEKERLRRRREMLTAFAAFVLALILTRILFYLYDTTSALFIAVFSLNFLLLIVIAVVVFRNALKLLLDRKRGVLGSRLRVRMTLAFVVMTLAPCLLMFVITMKFVQISVDFWFKDQISSSMELALEVGRADYEKTGLRLLDEGSAILQEAGEMDILQEESILNGYLREQKKVEKIALLGTLDPEQTPRLWFADQDAGRSWRMARSMFNWATVEKQGAQTILVPGRHNDYVFAAQVVPQGGFLISAESMGPRFKSKLDQLATANTEYKQLRQMRREVKWMLYLGLSVLTLLVVLAAIWFGFRVAKEISAPVLAVADAAEHIAKGDMEVRIESAYASDELGMLVRAFNSMAVDLEHFRENLTGANQMLAEQNRENLQHSQYVETILNNIVSGVISVDENGNITMVNTAACGILGSSPGDMLGRELLSLLPEDMKQQTRTMFEQFRLRPLSTWQRQINLQLFGQERRLLVRAAGLVTPEGKNRGFVAVFEDVSEMERMQRMAAWREVARRIAHEIKNPLTPIKLSAQRLQRKFGTGIEDPAFSQSTEMIVRQVESIQEMVQEFSSFAKLPEVDPQPGDITPIFLELIDLFRNSHSKIRWELELPDSIPLLPMDKSAMRRVFLNLLTNAAEALEGIASPKVKLTAVVDTERCVLRVSVSDNGPGLSETERSRLFEPYFSRKKSGTGLGLTIVRSVISDHKGYVRADSSPEGGAMLTVEIPLV